MTAAATSSLKLEVDPLGQTYDKILIYAANLPRAFDFAAPPAYEGTDRIILLTGLDANQTYQVVAFLKRGTELSPQSNIVQQKTLYPAPLVSTSATPDGTATFTLDTHGETATKYQVRMAKSPTIPKYPEVPGVAYTSNTNPIVVNNLEPGVYNFYCAYMVGTVWSAITEVKSITVDLVLPQYSPPVLRLVE